MEKEYDYTFNKMYPYMDTSVMKQKDVNNLMTLISSGRLKNLIEFEGFGVCEYDEDDKQLIHPYVTKFDKFNRLRTNVLIYNILDNDWSGGKYDKLFIFKTNWPKEPTYNIVFHNTQTNVSMHHPEIENANDIVAQDIMKVFNIIHQREIFEFQSNKIECSRKGSFNEFANEINFEPIKERYRNALWGDPKELARAE